MASYYYLISSLPDLKTDGDMPMTYEEFLHCCQGVVSEKDYSRLESLTLSSSEGPFMKKWSDFYGMLKSELNYQRSVLLGKTYPSGYDKDGMIAQVAGAAVNARNPLEAEKILLDCEFENLDALVGMHMFDDTVLFGYALKLKLLERLSCMKHDRGEAEFRKLFSQVQERVYSL